jgi:hypothetical protein
MRTSKAVSAEAERALADERLQIRYVVLETLALWDRNPKKHDLAKLAESIRRYGFKDPPRFEPALNGGSGGIVEGNGRALVLRAMQEAREEPPRGIAVDESGRWHAPVLFGVDARSRAEAEAYGVDHNLLTLAGGGFAVEDVLRIYDEEQLQALLRDVPDATALLVGLDGADLDALLQGPSFDAVAAGDQPRLDEKKAVTCPKCGEQFRP